MLIKEVQLRNYPYQSRSGLAERIAKNYFEKSGYEVFRGQAILRNSINYHVYENVKRKYDRLENILLNKLGLDLYLLRNQLKKGIPDFFCFRKQDKRMFFAEIKLEHEQIKPHQLECMSILEKYGFNVVLIRIKSKMYRAESIIKLQGNIEENKKLSNRKIIVKQEKIRVRY